MTQVWMHLVLRVWLFFFLPDIIAVMLVAMTHDLLPAFLLIVYVFIVAQLDLNRFRWWLYKAFIVIYSSSFFP